MITVWLLLLIFSLAYFWVRRTYSYFERHGIPHDPPSFPMGNLKKLGNEHPAQIIQKLYMKYKGKAPVCGYFMYLKKNIIITDLDVIKDILFTSFDSFRNRGHFFNAVDDPLTANLVTIEDNEWRMMRQKWTTAFTSGKMRKMFTTIADKTDFMVDILKSSTDLNMLEVRDALASLTIEVVGNVAFGLELNTISDPNAKFRVMSRKLLDPNENFTTKLQFLASFRDLAKKLHLTLLPKDLSEFFMGNIRETVDYRIRNKVDRNDFLNLMMKMYTGEDSANGPLSFNELAAQCFIFYITAFETTSTTLTFLFYHLAMNQDIQDKLREEIKSIVEKENGRVTYEGVKEMKYLQMAIEEALRLQGPLPRLIRHASNDYKVPNTNFVIKKGTLIVIPIYSIHHDPDIYPDPDKFDPERFSDEEKLKRHPMSWLAFGEGHRICVGLTFGIMQTKVVVAKLLLNFRFVPTERTPEKIMLHPKIPVLSPAKEMYLKLEKL